MRPGTRLEPSPRALLVARSRAWLTSVALHAVLALALVFGAVFTWHTKPEPVHSIEAYVARGAAPSRPAAAPAAVPAPAPAPTPEPAPVNPAPNSPPPNSPPPEAARAPAPDADAAQAAKSAAAKAAALKAETLKADAARLQATQKAAQAKQEAQAKAKAQAAEKQRAEAALAAQVAQEKADLASRKQRESDLAKQLAAEEHADALTAAQAGLLARYKAEITGRVQRAWIRPPAKAGLRCIVHVTQVPGGTVTGVRVGECNADAAVRQSIEAAVYRASPLPPPPDPSLFDRNLTLEFAPDA